MTLIVTEAALSRMTGPVARVGWQIPDPTGPEYGIEFAPHGPRLAAYLIDIATVISIAVALLLAIGVVFVTGASAPDDGTTVVISAGAAIGIVVLLAVMLVLILLYFPFFWARTGQTPGMWVFGLRVVCDQDGGRIGWGTALLRTLGMFAASALFYLGFIWIFVDTRRRGFHDLIAGTVVVRRSALAVSQNRGTPR